MATDADPQKYSHLGFGSKPDPKTPDDFEDSKIDAGSILTLRRQVGEFVVFSRDVIVVEFGDRQRDSGAAKLNWDSQYPSDPSQCCLAEVAAEKAEWQAVNPALTQQDIDWIISVSSDSNVAYTDPLLQAAQHHPSA
ncbi:uncharacterized protein V6R79_020545 [Siganus canaliculatus]